MPIIGSFGAGSAGGYGQRKGGRNELIFATGGCVTVCGDYRIHVFTGPGTFCVTAGGGDLGVADYMVVAGGGGGGPRDGGSGGGAGGFREAKTGNNGCYTASPLANPVGIQIEPGAYPITVGAGAPGPGPGGPCATRGGSSIFGDITSTGGGKGDGGTGQPGGSGGGNYGPVPASPVGDRLGNDPPVSPPQGNDGGIGTLPGFYVTGGGGGGAGTAGGLKTAGVGVGTEGFGPTGPSYGTPGPAGPLRYFSGAGAGSGDPRGGGGGAPGGYGGGGASGPPGPGVAGTTNTGGGGGGAPNGTGNSGGNGGSGIVMIRYKFQ